MKPRWSDLRPFLALFRPYLWWLAGGLGLSVATLTGSLGLLGLSGGFLTATGLAGLVPETAQLYNVVIPAGGIRLFALVRTAGRWSERVINHEATFRLLGQLRVWLYQRFSRLSPRQLGLWHGAEVLNRLTRDVDLLDNLFIRLLAPIAAATVVMGCLTAVVWVLAPSAAWVAAALSVAGLVVVPAAVYLTARTLSPRLVERNEDLRRVLLDLVEGLEDSFLHRPAWESQRQAVREADSLRLADQVTVQRRGSAARAVLVALIGLAAWGVIGLIASAPGQGLDGPWFVALTLLVLGTGEALLGLPAAWIELPGTENAARRLSELADQTPEPAFVDTMDPAGTLDLTLEAVGFEYNPGEAVLDSITAAWPLGTHVALVGPSGEGKTTLVRLLTRLEDPTRGRVVLGGRDLREWDETSLRSAVACSMQDPWTFTATVAENLRLAAPDATDEDLLTVLTLVGLEGQVTAWPQGLNTAVDEGGQSLSGGQRRRLAVARALLRRAPVTVLDEPTEGLEAEAALALVQCVRKELAGRTLVWVTHRPQGLDGFAQVRRLTRGGLSTN
jgi:ATP-binding cassette subfamily C protein CydC